MADESQLTFRSAIPLPEARTVDVDGISTRYYEAGSGEPIIFIYGGNFGTSDSGSGAYTWNLNLTPLSARFRAIAFDKLGQGYTDNPLNDNYTMDAVVQHAAGFIRALKLPPVHIVGHSRGGFAATRLTLEHQSLIKTLTIINSGTLSPAVSTNEVILSKCPFPPFTVDAARWVYSNYSFRPEVATDDWMDATVAALITPKYRESVRKIVDEQLGARLFAPSLSRMKRETITWLQEGRLQRPTQIVWGFNDRTIHVEAGVQLFKMLAPLNRHTQIHLINEAGHFPFREHPARFNALLARFASHYAN
jgi:2-hydroxy-6-oxonona-2,4-dienedioate hydrolase